MPHTYAPRTSSPSSAAGPSRTSGCTARARWSTSSRSACSELGRSSATWPTAPGAAGPALADPPPSHARTKSRARAACRWSVVVSVSNSGFFLMETRTRHALAGLVPWAPYTTRPPLQPAACAAGALHDPTTAATSRAPRSNVRRRRLAVTAAPRLAWTPLGLERALPQHAASPQLVNRGATAADTSALRLLWLRPTGATLGQGAAAGYSPRPARGVFIWRRSPSPRSRRARRSGTSIDRN